jgi:hypothetical protein
MRPIGLLVRRWTRYQWPKFQHPENKAWIILHEGWNMEDTQIKLYADTQHKGRDYHTMLATL